MTKTELINELAKTTGMPKVDLDSVLGGLSKVVTKALIKGDKIKLKDIGSFEVRERATRKGRNPQTGEEIDIPAHKVPVFKASSVLKDAIK